MDALTRQVVAIHAGAGLSSPPDFLVEKDVKEGKFAIVDIQHGREYADFLRVAGVVVAASKPNYSYCPPLMTVEGSKP